MEDDFNTFWALEAEIQQIRSNIIELIIMLDTSGSMTGKRIMNVNFAMAQLPKLIKDFEEYHHIQLRLRVVKFDDDARWVLGDAEHYVSNYAYWYDHAIETRDWIPLNAMGSTATDRAQYAWQGLQYKTIFHTLGMGNTIFSITYPLLLFLLQMV